MREILFRGKRLDNGEWVEGGYKHEKVGEYLTAVFIIEHLTSEVWENHRVDPATVGQYTGLTDKNDVKIFERDIIRCHTGRIMVVRFGQHYDEENEAWAYGWFVSDDEGDLYLGEEWSGHEVIGNIHDNPELLGGDES